MASPLLRRTFASYVLLLLVYVASPPIAPGLPGDEDALRPGVRIDSSALDATPWIVPLTGAEFCYIDGDGIGTYSNGEALFLRPSGGCTASNAGRGSLRMAAFSGQAAGRFIRAVDTEGSAPARSFSPDVARFKHLDLNGDGVYSPGDGLYVDALAIPSHRVDPGDVRVVATDHGPGGVHVEAGDPDVGARLSILGEAGQLVGYADADGTNTFTPWDPLYMRRVATSSPAVAAIGDLRLGGATPEEYGTWLHLGDPDAPARLRRMANAALCYAGEGTGYGAGDTIVVRAAGCAGSSQAGDQRLASDARRGARIASGDPDAGVTLRVLGATLSYRNMVGGSGLDGGDAVYLDVVGSANRIDAGDVRLTPDGSLPAAAPVRSGDADAGRSATILGSPSDYLAYMDATENGLFDGSDLLYLNRDGQFVQDREDVEVGDVRLGTGADGGFSFGSWTTTGSPEVVRRTTVRSFSVCLVDQDGDLLHDAGEMLYLNLDGCGNGVGLNALRLTEGAGGPAGSQVRTGSEVGTSAVSPSASAAYLDADASGTWTPGDALYVHFTAASSDNKITAGDVRLTAYGDFLPGSTVSGADQDRGVPLVTMASSLGSITTFFDADQSGGYSAGDPVYLAPGTTSAQSATHGYVRATALAAPPMTPDPADADGSDDGPSPGDGAGDLRDQIDRAQDQLDRLREQSVDSDGDGFADSVERQRGTDPQDPDSYPGKGVTKRSPGPSAMGLMVAAGAALLLFGGRPRRPR